MTDNIIEISSYLQDGSPLDDGKNAATLSLDGKTVSIQLTQGFRTTIDAADWDSVKGHKWSAHASSTKIYASSSIGRKTVRIHAFLLSTPKGLHSDHINGITLDNRRSNLRISTVGQNAQNRSVTVKSQSKFKGVFPCKGEKYIAQIMAPNKKRIHLGTYNSAAVAARAYDAEAIRLYGAFARTNASMGLLKQSSHSTIPALPSIAA